MNNEEINKIILRAKNIFGFKYKKQLAESIGISQQNFSNQKGRGSILEKIEKEALKRKVNYDWILTGKGEPYSETIQINKIKNNLQNQAMKDLIEIFESGDSGSIQALTSVLALCKQTLKEKKKFDDRNNIRKEDRPEDRDSLIKQRAM